MKGDLMYIEGKLRTRQYTDQQGIVRYITEVNVDKMMQLAPTKPPQQSSYNQGYSGTPSQPRYEAPAQPAPTDPFASNPLPADDLPF